MGLGCLPGDDRLQVKFNYPWACLHHEHPTLFVLAPSSISPLLPIPSFILPAPFRKRPDLLRVYLCHPRPSSFRSHKYHSGILRN